MTKVLLLGFLLVAASSHPAKASGQPYFEMENSASRALVEKALQIKVGDSHGKIIGLLGEPTYDQVLLGKASGHREARVLKYYVVIWEEGLVNESKDQLIRLVLDEHDRVSEVQVRVSIEQ